MVKITKIYTRTGDDGSTGLVSGARVAKDHPRVVAYGTVDEANAAIGIAIAELRSEQAAVVSASASEHELLADELLKVQNDLFDLGADLATPEPIEGALRIVPEQVERIEGLIDAWNDRLGPLDSFVLPGGSRSAAALHAARTITRRAERTVVTMLHAESGTDTQLLSLRYLNRLSDFLFVAARIANDRGASDVKWVPGQSRDDAGSGGGSAP